jgi:phage baseplate assembly protein W
MASIILNTLKNKAKNEDNYTYTDFFLDLQEDNVKSSNFIYTTGTNRDIKVAYDLNAIRNSLRNLFNTVKGERYLQPEYGSDLRRYIFEPITERTGSAIASEIKQSINNWEPRVKLTGLQVYGYEDRNEYEITISLAVPFLTEPLNLKGLLNRQGFSY